MNVVMGLSQVLEHVLIKKMYIFPQPKSDAKKSFQTLIMNYKNFLISHLGYYYVFNVLNSEPTYVSL